MSISNTELRGLIRRAEDAGAQVIVAYNVMCEREGRAIISCVKVLPTSLAPWSGIGPGWMSPIAAAEALRAAIAKLPA